MAGSKVETPPFRPETALFSRVLTSVKLSEVTANLLFPKIDQKRRLDVVPPKLQIAIKNRHSDNEKSLVKTYRGES